MWRTPQRTWHVIARRARTVLACMALAVGAASLPATASAGEEPAEAGGLTPPAAGSFLHLTSEAGDYVGGGAEYLYTSADAAVSGWLSGDGRSLSASVANLTDWWYVNIEAPEGDALGVGAYEGAGRFAGAGTPGLDVSGNGRGCSVMTGRFDVVALEVGQGGELLGFEAEFEQHCEGAAAALFGHIRIENDTASTDETPPVLFLPDQVSVGASDATGSVVWYVSSAWDDRDGWIGVSCTPESGAFFPIGTTTVECTATDTSGNSSMGSFPVTVVADETPPVLVLPGPMTVDAWSPDGAHVWYWADAWDDRDGWVPVSCFPESGSRFPVGTTTVECTATDFSGNASSGSFTVTVVRDEDPPILTLPDPMTVEAWSPEGAFVWYSASGWDERDGFIFVQCSPPPASLFPVGTTTVECTATDFSGNTTSGSFTVTVLPPLAVTVTITGGSVDPVSGVATIRGTIECSRGGAPSTPVTAWVSGQVTQRLGRMLIRASLSTQVECTTSAGAWSATTQSSTGLFVPGNADVDASAFAGFASGSAQATVRLTGTR